MFFDDEQHANIKEDENTKLDSKPDHIEILPNIPLANSPYLSNEMDDLTRLRLALARTKFLGKINLDLPTIRSATNTPSLKLTKATLNKGTLRNSLPIIRSSGAVQENNLPVIRSSTNVPRSKVIITKPMNSLNFLASRMRLI